jgi:2-C-methyl-D-erythritol 2,4-cyclodiphosphate synthase
MIRIGIGYDVHRLTEGRPLILGGRRIDFDKGLLGHSDADVLVHAACDALLGAAGLGDIGRQFPDTDPGYKDIYSIELLSRCARMVADQGYVLGNLDATVFAQAPKLAPFVAGMRETMAQALTSDTGRVNIKATTTEGLGYIGAGEGMAAMVVVTLVKKSQEGVDAPGGHRP